MAGLLTRFKTRKTVGQTVNNQDPDTKSIASFEEQGFICPICRSIFENHTELTDHYSKSHAQPIVNSNYVGDGQPQDPAKEITKLKDQFLASEESRIILSNLLTSEKQRVADLEADISALEKQLRVSQMKIAELSSKNGKENSSNNSAKDENRLIQLRIVLGEHCRLFEQFDENFLLYDEIFKNKTSTIQMELNEMKQFIQSTRERKKKIDLFINSFRNTIKKNEQELQALKKDNVQLREDLRARIELNEKLKIDLQTEQKQTNSFRHQINALNNDVTQFKKMIRDLKQDKSELIQSNMKNDQNDERQAILRNLSAEKDQIEKENQELREQLKQKKYEQEQIEDDRQQLTQQMVQISEEKTVLETSLKKSNDEISALKQQLNQTEKDQERKTNQLHEELSASRENFFKVKTNLENELQLINDQRENQQREFSQWKEQLMNEIKQIEDEKQQAKAQISQHERTIEAQQMTLKQLRIQYQQKDTYLQRLITNIRRYKKMTTRIQMYLHTNVEKSQNKLFITLEKIRDEHQKFVRLNVEEIGKEIDSNLKILQSATTETKERLLLENSELSREIEVKWSPMQEQYDFYFQTSNQQKLEIENLNKKLLEVSAALSKLQRTFDGEREKFTNAENQFESRAKKYEMQLTALRENLVSLRTELRLSNEKLAQFDQLKAEKTDLETRFNLSQDERHALLERLMLVESKSEKLSFENNQLVKKNVELDEESQEINRKFQALQVQMVKLQQRRWLNDDDVHKCMNCRESFTVTQRKHHCRCCGKIFCDSCSAKTAIVAASSKKPKRVCDQCYNDLNAG